MANYRNADNALLRKCASIVRTYIQKRAPTDKSAASFHAGEPRNGTIHVTTTDTGSIAVNQPLPLGQRHPVFATGPRDTWTWVDQNKGPRGSTHKAGYVSTAVRAAADEAADSGLDEWLRQVSIDSRYYSYHGS